MQNGKRKPQKKNNIINLKNEKYRVAFVRLYFLLLIVLLLIVDTNIVQFFVMIYTCNAIVICKLQELMMRSDGFRLESKKRANVK